jgi:hypothetical protein
VLSSIPIKEQIAFAQSYFAIQTTKKELFEECIQLMEGLQARKSIDLKTFTKEVTILSKFSLSMHYKIQLV